MVVAKPSKTRATHTPAPKARRDPLSRWLAIAAGIFVLIATCTYLDKIKHRWYIMEPEYLHELAQRAVATHGNDTRAMVDLIVDDLKVKYSTKHINPRTEEWFFNNAGGAMGAMYVIHASITEYLIIFGTPLGTEGHTGRHTADDYFNILYGEQWAFAPGGLEKEVYPAGSVHHLPRGTVKQYKMHEGCWALEYARGWIPLMLPFGLADTMFSTLDIPTFWVTFSVSGREIIKNLLAGKI